MMSDDGSCNPFKSSTGAASNFSVVLVRRGRERERESRILGNVENEGREKEERERSEIHYLVLCRVPFSLFWPSATPLSMLPTPQADMMVKEKS